MHDIPDLDTGNHLNRNGDYMRIRESILPNRISVIGAATQLLIIKLKLVVNILCESRICVCVSFAVNVAIITISVGGAYIVISGW